ncbi:MAG: hypothetical protein HY721_11940, partial [Planctomycetes bacterium]|nr:hypothetical protein [Planctomycetota bacterium]
VPDSAAPRPRKAASGSSRGGPPAPPKRPESERDLLDELEQIIGYRIEEGEK